MHRPECEATTSNAVPGLKLPRSAVCAATTDVKPSAPLSAVIAKFDMLVLIDPSVAKRSRSICTHAQGRAAKLSCNACRTWAADWSYSLRSICVDRALHAPQPGHQGRDRRGGGAQRDEADAPPDELLPFGSTSEACRVAPINGEEQISAVPAADTVSSQELR